MIEDSSSDLYTFRKTSRANCQFDKEKGFHAYALLIASLETATGCRLRLIALSCPSPISFNRLTRLDGEAAEVIIASIVITFFSE